MTLDLVVLFVVVVFALWGAFAGAAKQLATLLAGVLGWLAAGPAGQFFGPMVAKQLATSALVGVVLATLASFVVVLLFVQLVGTLLIRRVLAGRDPNSRFVDRALGFGLGGAKVFAVVYVGLCAMSFLEQNVTILGKRLAFSPKDSRLMDVVRRYNLLEQQQFSGASELARVAQLAKTPKGQQRLRDEPDFAALLKDPRFSKVLGSAGLQRALETGDVRALLTNNDVVELIQDPAALRRLERLGELAP